MREYVVITMKSGRQYQLILHNDESFRDIVKKIFQMGTFFKSADIILNTTEIECIEKGDINDQ